MKLKPEKIDPREVAAIFAFVSLLQAAPLDRVLIMAGLGMLIAIGTNKLCIGGINEKTEINPPR